MYPGGEGEYASLPGSGFLRLHSTYRHDLKVYASDEGRVQMTAAAFTKVIHFVLTISVICCVRSIRVLTGLPIVKENCFKNNDFSILRGQGIEIRIMFILKSKSTITALQLCCMFHYLYICHV